jgi:hypothetical protein
MTSAWDWWWRKSKLILRWFEETTDPGMREIERFTCGGNPSKSVKKNTRGVGAVSDGMDGLLTASGFGLIKDAP